MTAFGVLAVTAALMFGIRESGFVISVFANGVAQIPSEVKPEATLFHVEVNMLAELNTVDGYFTVRRSSAHFPRLDPFVPAHWRLRPGQLVCTESKRRRLRVHCGWSE